MKFQLPLGGLYNAANKLIGKKENVHFVQFIFPDVTVGGAVLNFMVKYVLQQQISPQAGSYSADVLNLYNGLIRKIHGGIPIAGKLIIDNDNVSFKPIIGQTIFIKGYEKVIIPVTDITAVNKGDKWLGAAEFVAVTTIYGEFKCYVTPGYMGVNTGDEICAQINSMIKPS